MELKNTSLTTTAPQEIIALEHIYFEAMASFH